MNREPHMFRLFFFLLCSFAFALQVLVTVGCSVSPSNTTTASGSGNGPGSNGGSGNASSSACSGSGFGYNNQNGTITGVWLQNPSPGQNPSHVQVNAIAYATDTVTRWTVCLDDQAVYQTNNPASSISQ